MRVGHEKLAFYKPGVRVRAVSDKVGELFVKGPGDFIIAG